MGGKQAIALHEVRRYLEPGPVVLVSSAWQGERDAAAVPRHPETLHYKGDGVFMVSGKIIRRRRPGLK